MKKAKRIVSVLLAISMLVGLQLPVSFAAEAQEYVFFETDFEKDTPGGRPTGFNSVLATATSVIEVIKDGNTNAIHYYRSPEAEGSGGPRLDKLINIRTLKELDIEYDVKWKEGASTFGVTMLGAESGAPRTSFPMAYKYDDWTHVNIHVDFENLSATTYAGGKEIKSIEIQEYTDGDATIQFMGLVQPDGSEIIVDNIKISTKQEGYDPNESLYLNPNTIKTPYNRADELPESGDLAEIIREDFETLKTEELVTSTKTGFKTFAVTNVAPIRVYEENGNKYAKAYHGDPVGNPTERGQRMGKVVPTTDLNTLTIDMDVKSEHPGQSKLLVNLFDTVKNKDFARLILPSTFKDWTHVKLRFDFPQGKAIAYVAGKLYKEYPVTMSATAMEIRIAGSISPDGSDWMVDNVLVTTPDKDAGGYISLSGEFYANKVALAPEEEFGMTKVMRTGHPRLFLHDWQEVRAKIGTDTNYQIWYNNLLRTANGFLNATPTEYSINERGNINEDSTTAKNIMVVLAGAYGLTGDVRYKDRLWKELEQVGNWPDWDSKTYLCTAHVILGFAVAYDWLYNDWTPAEREQIENWLVQKGMSQAVLAYEGQLDGSGNWINRVSNWSNVCNGSNMIAALALAEKYPRLAEYILVRGNAALQDCFVEVSEDGAYAETVGYWDYGIRHQVKLMAALDTCLAEGASLPPQIDYKNNRGLDKTGDYSIYYNGTVNCFNFGDGSSGFSTTPIMYWLSTKYDKPQYAWYDAYLLNNYDNVKHPSDRSAIWSILWYDAEHTAKADPTFNLDKFYSSTEPDGANGISMRGSWTDTDTMVVMAHAGDAKTGHMNHDAGGFVLDWAGHRWVHMYGREPAGTSAGIVYGWPGYHNHVEKGGHFDYYHCRGEANNTIIANPQQDMPDMKVDYYAPMERFESGTNTAYGIIDMTDTNVDYTSAKRGFMLTDMRETLIIQDEIEANKPSEFYWFVNTLADITIAADGKSALLEMDDDAMLVRITQGPADAKLSIMETRPLPTSPNPSVQADVLDKLDEEKLFIHLKDAQTLNLTVEFVPIRDGEGLPPAQPIVPLDAWSVNGAPELTTSQKLGDIVALKIDNPNAYAKGAKTYVDTANLEIKPITQNGRTLVPVRFIAEKFGATVGWDDATQTVSVKTDVQDITLQIGSTQMNVNGNIVTLDVPAQTIGGRTLIPLRALVEALGKQVFWDDRGLIIISDAAVNYDAQTIDKIIDLLDIRVQINGKELSFFDSEVYTYYYAADAFALPTVTASSNKGATVLQGNPATVTVGDKTYTIHFAENSFAGIGGGPEAIRKYILTPDNGQKPTMQNFLPIQSATSSVEWSADKYPMNGTYDSVIHDSITQHRWSASGMGHWIAYDFGEVKTLHSFGIAGFMSDQRSYTWEVAISNDGVNWNVINPGAATTLGVDHDVIKLGDVQARYVRLTGVSAVNTTWLGICEVRFYENAAQEAADQATWFAQFYDDKIYGCAGQTRKVTIQGINGNGETVVPAISDYVIVSANPAVATVDAAGNITLVAAGKTKINLTASVAGVVRNYSIDVVVQ